MSAKKTDISQIRKYLNGELDARAMHQLEREAQDDPFLMDALEGYAVQDKDQQVNLDKLQQRLQDRINHLSKKRILLWPVISIAASVLVLMGVGLWFYIGGSSAPSPVAPKANNTVVIEKPVAPVVRAPSAPVDNQPELKSAISKPANNNLGIVHNRVKKHIIANEPIVAETASVIAMVPKVSPADSIAKDNMLKEVIVTGYATQRKKDITGALSTVQSTTINTPLQSRVAGVEVKTPTAKDRMYTQQITGRVISNDDQKPLPGVTVTVLGKKTGTMTDANGVFKMEATNNDNLKLGFVGYDSKQVAVKGDSLNVTLNPSQASLSEVVFTGYGASKDIIEEAHPRSGWDSFKKYLDAAISPDSKKGKVRVRFVVNADNTLSDFKITKSLSPDADAEAMRLIKEGPAWIHNVNGEPETVTLRITFK